MTKKVMIVLFFSLIFLVVNSAFAKDNIEFLPQNQLPSVLELAFLRELGPSIADAMYLNGNEQLFTSGRIERIIRNVQEDYYDVTLRVAGFKGPLNPPYTLINITFRIPAGDYSNKNKVISYNATSITGEEFKRLSEFSSP